MIEKELEKLKAIEKALEDLGHENIYIDFEKDPFTFAINVKAEKKT